MIEGLEFLFVGFGALGLLAAFMYVAYARGRDTERGRWNDETLKHLRRKE